MINSIENFIVLDMVKVSQLQTGIVFTGKMTFAELKKIYKLTERKESLEDKFGNETLDFDKSSQEFQRQLSATKLKEISDYLLREIKNLEKTNGKSLAMFPSSLILYNRHFEPDDLANPTELAIEKNILSENEILESYTSKLNCCFYRSVQGYKDLYRVYIPNNPEITLIVDGQHRFMGTMSLYDKLDSAYKSRIDSFEFIITYLVGFDVYEVGEIFATVNFNQKPVNRSLYYDIFGSAPQTDRGGKLQNDIRLAHDLALHLQNSDQSPIKGMIKLLGKGYGLFSQAFFVDKLLRYVFKTGIWDDYLIDYQTGGDKYLEIGRFMRAYFSALQQSYPSSWPERVFDQTEEKQVYSSFRYPFVLCKTTGLGAYFRLIKDIYPIVSVMDNGYLENIVKIFKKLSDQEAKDIFSKQGPYSGAGSEGLQDKLYLHLKNIYFN